MRSPDEILLHPVRLRIVLAIAGRTRTTAEIREDLGDVPTATLYRHVNRLIDAGVLEVVAEQPVRGGSERTLALAEAAASFTPEDLAGTSADELLGYFVRVMAGLIGDFGRYLQSPSADPAADKVGFRQVPVWLTDIEFDDFASRMNALIAAAHENEPIGRRRRVLTTVVIPDPRQEGD